MKNSILSILKWTGIGFLVLFLAVMANDALALQAVTVEGLNEQVTRAGGKIKSMIATIIGVILVLGGAFVIYEFVTGSERARKHLVLFVAGLVIYGIMYALRLFS